MPISNVQNLQDICAQTLLRASYLSDEAPNESQQNKIIDSLLTKIEARTAPRSQTSPSAICDLKTESLQCLLNNIDQLNLDASAATPKQRKALNAFRFRVCEAIWQHGPHPDSRLVRFAKGNGTHPSKTARLFLKTITQVPSGVSAAPSATKVNYTAHASLHAQIKNNIVLALQKTLQSQPELLKKQSFDALKSRLKQHLDQLHPEAAQTLPAALQYRLQTELDLAAQILYVVLQGSDDGITGSITDYDTPSYVNNAFKKYLDTCLADKKPLAETLRFLSNVTLKAPLIGAPAENYLTVKQLTGFPDTYAILGKRFNVNDRINACGHWLVSTSRAKHDFVTPGRDKSVLDAKLSSLIKHNMIAAVNPTNSSTALTLQTELERTLDKFSKQVKQLFPEMSKQDIHRAKTNVWTLFVLQRLFHGKFESSPAAIGYSALYPLTDSLIDDPNITKDVKKIFFKTFHDKITQGSPDISTIARMEIPDSIKDIFADMWNAFDLIEYQYDRNNNPQTYEALRRLHASQLDSKVQDFEITTLESAISEHIVPQDVLDKAEDIFEVTVRKGFLSVLGDAFLVTGDKLPGPNASFSGHLGTLAQFINDAIAVTEDIRTEGHITPHNLAWLKDNANSADGKQHKHFDQITNQIFHYVNWVFEQPEHKALFDDTESQFQFESIKSYINMKLIMAVAKNRDFHSQAFLDHIQKFTPFSLETLEKLNILQERRFQADNNTAHNTTNQAHTKSQAFAEITSAITVDYHDLLKNAPSSTRIQVQPIVNAVTRATAKAKAPETSR